MSANTSFAAYMKERMTRPICSSSHAGWITLLISIEEPDLSLITTQKQLVTYLRERNAFKELGGSASNASCLWGCYSAWVTRKKHAPAY